MYIKIVLSYRDIYWKTLFAIVLIDSSFSPPPLLPFCLLLLILKIDFIFFIFY